MDVAGLWGTEATVRTSPTHSKRMITLINHEDFAQTIRLLYLLTKVCLPPMLQLQLPNSLNTSSTSTPSSTVKSYPSKPKTTTNASSTTAASIPEPTGTPAAPLAKNGMTYFEKPAAEQTRLASTASPSPPSMAAKTEAISGWP